MPAPFLLLDPADDLVVALRHLPAGTRCALPEGELLLPQEVPAKHKFFRRAVEAGDIVRMYGVTVGRVHGVLPKGALVTTANLHHAVDETPDVDAREPYHWTPPALPPELPTTFEGFYRSTGEVGTANLWLVVPLVFCENRNVEALREALETQLGYRSAIGPRFDLSALVGAQRGGQFTGYAAVGINDVALREPPPRVFPNVEGIRFLTHEGGCGGTRADSDRLVDLVAAYLVHPNVAGATVLSLGCQNAQAPQLVARLAALGATPSLSRVSPGIDAGHYGGRPLVIAEQQGATDGEPQFLAEVLRQTFLGLAEAERTERRPAPVRHLSLGLECGGSDGFSGISANPLLGRVSDWLVGLSGRSILAEFPELNGVEGALIRRCERGEDARRFRSLMRDYGAAAERAGSGFAYNPSPGNIREGLITDAMKSAGAARKGGTAPIAGVHDYTEIPSRPGLHLLCTPGNDVESTTALAASGATLIAFTTGLGTPTGNPLAPTLKVSSNSRLAETHADLIDFDAGQLIGGRVSREALAGLFWRKLIDTASGRYVPKATRLGQFDFIPWRRDLSL